MAEDLYGSTCEWEFPTCDVRLGRLLMRVCTVPQRSPLNGSGEFLRFEITRGVFLPEVSTDNVIVLGCHLESLEREFVPQRLPNIPLTIFPSLQEAVVI